MFRRLYLIITLLISPVLVTAVAGQNAHAQKDAVYTSFRNNFGAGGYDVVSFHAGNPVKGDVQFLSTYNGAEWKFSSQINKDLFDVEPVKYAPAYGGYCAWAIANGKVVKGSPKHWSIENETLYLNFNKGVKKKWDADRAKFITDGDIAWPEILDK